MPFQSRLYQTIAFIFTLLVITGCSPRVTAVQNTFDGDPLPLTAGHSFGQTFTAHQAGLNAVDLRLEPGQPGDGVLVLHLRSGPTETADLAEARLSLQDVTRAKSYRFSIPLQPDSRQKDYYVSLELTGQGEVRLPSGPGDTYLDGALYQDGEPVDRQAAFRLVYEPGTWLLGWAAQGLEWLKWLGIGILAFILPGWALLGLLWPRWAGLSAGEKLGLSAGMSLALYPLLLLWTHLVGLQLGSLYAWIPAAASLAYLGYRGAVWVRNSRGKYGQPFTAWLRSPALLPDLALLIALSLVFLVRFFAIRNLEIPLWGDSYQHTLIAQLIVDNGGLFNSWQPYAPYTSLTIHFGFSAAAAVAAWLANVRAYEAVLWTGQLINGLAVLSLYPIAVRIAKGNRWAGVAAVMIAGFFTQMPMFYVNWGRYAQLAGQVILPCAIWFFVDSIEQPRFRWGQVLLLGITLVGMTLSYYRMPFYFITFILSWGLFWAIHDRRRIASQWLQAGFFTAAMGVIVLVLLIPWIARLSGGALAASLETGLTTSKSDLQVVLEDYRRWRAVFEYVPRAVVVLSILAAFWSLFKRSWTNLVVYVWFGLLGLLKLGQLIHLPGAAGMESTPLMMSLYIPLALVVGCFFGLVTASRVFQGVRWIPWLWLALAVCGSGAGAYLQRNITRPDTFALVTRPDLRAMEWIRTNTDNGSRFLVEGFLVYDGHSAVGSDAGWWLPLLGSRQNSMPPQYALINEKPESTHYSSEIIHTVAVLEDENLASPTNVDLLCEQGITHLYIGQGQGKVGYGAQQLFSPEELAASDAFQVVYHQDRTYVYGLNEHTCPNSQ